jgi:hypothetical protein
MSEGGPIFIIGNPRSGTTLLRLMLTCHPRVCVPPECGFAVWLYDKYRDWRPEQVEDFARDVLACYKIETWHWDTAGLAPFLRSNAPQTYARAAELVYLWYARCQGREDVRWGDKNNFHLSHIETLREIFPLSAFVHIVRDPRSIACSYRRLGEAQLASPYAPKLPANLEDAALHWRTNVRTISAAFDRLKWQGVHQIRFEDLVATPRATLECLCEFLGERFETGMLDYHARNRDHELEPVAFDSWKSKTRLPPMAEEAGRYQTELTAVERRQVESLVTPELQQFGYPLETDRGPA